MTNTAKLNQRLHELAARRESILKELGEIDTRMDELRLARRWMTDGTPEPVEDVPPELPEDEEIEEEEEEEDEEEAEAPAAAPAQQPYAMPTEMFGVDLTKLDERTKMRVMSGDAKAIEALGGKPPTRVPVSIADFTGR